MPDQQLPSESLLKNSYFLVVEAYEDFRVAMKRALLNASARRVSEASNGLAALGVLGREPVDIVLLAHDLDPIDGLDFTRRVRDPNRTPNPDVRIIMLSNQASREEVLAAWGAGIDEFLVKPVTWTAVLERLQAVIENPRPFIRVSSYVGPDRRRTTVSYDGPDRRAANFGRLNQKEINRLMTGED